MLRDEGSTEEAVHQKGLASALPPFDDPKYRAEIADLNLTEEQATEFLYTLDFILRSFVDLGLGVDSVQNFIPALREFSMDSQADGLEQKENKDAFNSAVSSGKEADR
jgi:hypothetical protein